MSAFFNSAGMSQVTQNNAGPTYWVGTQVLPPLPALPHPSPLSSYEHPLHGAIPTAWAHPLHGPTDASVLAAATDRRRAVQRVLG